MLERLMDTSEIENIHGSSGKGMEIFCKKVKVQVPMGTKNLSIEKQIKKYQ